MHLSTEHLLLRPFTLSDVDALYPILSHPEVMRFSTNGPLSYEETLRFLERIIKQHEEKGFGLWAVIHNNSLIGFSGLTLQTVDGEEKIELGYRFDFNYWGRGLAFEACTAVLEYAFHTLKLPELIAIIEAKNTRSIKLAMRVGMKYLKESTYYGIPVCIYSLRNTFC